MDHAARHPDWGSCTDIRCGRTYWRTSGSRVIGGTSPTPRPPLTEPPRITPTPTAPPVQSRPPTLTRVGRAISEAIPIERDTPMIAPLSAKEAAYYRIEVSPGTGTMNVEVECLTSAFLIVKLAYPGGKELPSELQVTEPTCNYDNYLLIGESAIGTYYLSVKPASVPSGEGDYQILITQDQQGERGQPDDVGDQFDRATLIGKGSYEGQVGQLDRADYYAFDATTDTRLMFLADQFASVGLYLLDNSGQPICRLESAPSDQQVVFGFSDRNPPGICTGELGTGRYVLGIVTEPDEGGAYKLLIR